MRALLVGLMVVGCGRVGFDPICGLDGPCVTAVTINGGSAYAPGPRLAVAVRVAGDRPAAEVRVTAGPCSFADDSWQPYDAAATYPVLVEPVDGVKQVCVWARDANGGLSEVTTATITYETQNLPIVEAFDVVATDATHLRATWTVSDVEGLATHPVDLEIKTAATWDSLALGIGDGPTGSIDLPAPPGPYIVRLTVTDRAGNRGVRAMSDVIGAPGWSIYAGSPDRGYGAAARAIDLQFSENSNYFFTVDPLTLDAYAWDRDFGIIRIDGATGQSEQLIGIGTSNLPDDGPLVAGAVVGFDPSVHVGPDGMLYVSTASGMGTLNSATIYQIDPRTRHCRRYLGGGTANDQTATPATVFVSKWIWTFDEDGTLYFLTSCTPGSAPSPLRMRIMKAARQPDGTAGAISIVAGNCATGAPPAGPVDATTVPLGTFLTFVGIGTMVAFDHGRVVYFASYPGTAAKVIDGMRYASDLPIGTTGEISYDPRTGTILVADGEVREYTPNRTGTSEPLVGTRLPETGTAACADDGVPASAACVHVGFTFEPTSDRVYFADGPALNEHRNYRIRFVDHDGLLRTYVGAPQFHGDGLPRRLVRSRIQGIAYKPASAPNQAAFPAGLMFVDGLAQVVGRIDEATSRATVVWGNQSGTPHTFVSGDALGPQVSLGRAYSGGTLQALAVDAQGFPIVRYGAAENDGALISSDSSGRAVVLQAGTQKWETAVDGTDPAQLDLWPYGTLNNLTVAGKTVFLLGGYSAFNPTATLRSLDFTNNVTKRLMGTGTDGFSADTATPANASLSASCHDEQFNCFTQYRAADDRLYFSEDNRLRYLTTPRNAATATLGTLFALGATVNIHNFTFRPDGSQVYYVSQGLRCHDLSSGQSSCNDTSLGPPGVFSPLGSAPDQLTWKDNNTLLISTYSGYVLQYSVP